MCYFICLSKYESLTSWEKENHRNVVKTCFMECMYIDIIRFFKPLSMLLKTTKRSQYQNMTMEVFEARIIN